MDLPTSTNTGNNIASREVVSIDFVADFAGKVKEAGGLRDVGYSS